LTGIGGSGLHPLAGETLLPYLIRSGSPKGRSPCPWCKSCLVRGGRSSWA